MAAESAAAINANAYTAGESIVFGAGQFAPASGKGLRLLAHELTHVVQQTQEGDSVDPEQRAKAVSEKIVSGRFVTPAMAGSAPHGVYADDEEQRRESPRPRYTLRLSRDELAGFPDFRLIQPSLRLPSPRRPSLNVPGLTPPGLSTEFNLRSGFEPTLEAPSLLEPSTLPDEDADDPSLPSRLNLLSSGRFRLGLRLGFPEAAALNIPSLPDSILSDELRRAGLIEQRLSGEFPSGFERVDLNDAARIVWFVFSTYIAPDAARGLSRRLTGTTGPAGASYELDLVLLGEFDGLGVSFTLEY